MKTPNRMSKLYGKVSSLLPKMDSYTCFDPNEISIGPNLTSKYKKK